GGAKAVQKAAQPITESNGNEVNKLEFGTVQKASNPPGCSYLQQPAGLDTKWRGGESNPQQIPQNGSQNDTLPCRCGATSGAPKLADLDLEEVIAVWPILKDKEKAAVMTLIRMCVT